MFEIRIHGFGGEGVVTLSEMFGKAATVYGKWGQSFPFFGTEVRGAAVKAFTRVSESPIRIKSYVYEPDLLIAVNEIILDDPETLKGIKKESIILINSAKDGDCFKNLAGCRIYTVDAAGMAYGIFGRPIVNTIMFGSAIGITGIVPRNSALEVIDEEFSGSRAALNREAFIKGHDIFKKVI